MTEEQGTLSVETADAMTIGINEALTRIATVKTTTTLVDSLSKEVWRNWDAVCENALACDPNGLDLSDEEDEDMLKAA